MLFFSLRQDLQRSTVGAKVFVRSQRYCNAQNVTGHAPRANVKPARFKVPRSIRVCYEAGIVLRTSGHITPDRRRRSVAPRKTGRVRSRLPHNALHCTSHIPTVRGRLQRPRTSYVWLVPHTITRSRACHQYL